MNKVHMRVFGPHANVGESSTNVLTEVGKAQHLLTERIVQDKRSPRPVLRDGRDRHLLGQLVCDHVVFDHQKAPDAVRTSWLDVKAVRGNSKPSRRRVRVFA